MNIADIVEIDGCTTRGHFAVYDLREAYDAQLRRTAELVQRQRDGEDVEEELVDARRDLLVLTDLMDVAARNAAGERIVLVDPS